METAQTESRVRHLTNDGEFWPPRPTYVVSHLALDPRTHLTGHLRPVTEKLQSVAAIVNAAVALEDGIGLEAREMALSEFARATGALLGDVAGVIHNSRDREAILARAELLNATATGTALVPLAEKIHSFRERELFLFCGRLRTWSSKPRVGMYSALAARPNDTLNALVDAIDTKEALSLARGALDDSALELLPPPVFSVCDLLMCAGEANRHPKHFAYFFPEDECFPGAEPPRLNGPTKTVLFANLFIHRYATSSYPRLERLVTGLDVESLRPDVVTGLLTTWMYGHDLGHSMRYPNTDLALNQTFTSKYSTMCLEETLADCYGYLVTMSCRSGALARLPAETCVAPFVAEMLRYLGRGIGLFPDSDAAMIELAYLNDMGYVRATPRGLEVRAERLHQGMLALTRTLNAILLGNDRDAQCAFVERYLHFGGDAVKAVSPSIHAMNALTRELPTSTTYTTWY